MTDDEKLMSEVLEALELHAKQYPHMQKGYTVDAITALRERLAQMQYGCHADLLEIPDQTPDECVLDTGNHRDCHYARVYGDKARQHCGEWKPIGMTPPTALRSNA